MKKLVYTIILISITIISCDVLDQEPVSIIASENFWTTAPEAEAGIASMYQPLREGVITREFFVTATCGGDGGTVDPSSGGNNRRMDRHEVTDQQGNTRDLWRALYEVNLRANDALENIPGIEDPGLDANGKRENLMGEAYFMRGFAYFTLLRWYGDVPLVLETTKTSDPELVNVPRDDIEDVYRQAISDFENALDMLPTSYSISEFTRGRATNGAANAYLAKIHLRRAYETFAEPNDFENAAAYALEVINNSLYELLPASEYGTQWAPDGGNTVESIWEFQTEQVGLNEGDNIQRDFEDPANGTRGDARARVLPTRKLIEAFQENPDDIRFPIVISEVIDDELRAKGFTHTFTKFNRFGGQQVPNLQVMRLPDLMLIRAEALNELGNSAEAISLVNAIRLRANIPPVPIGSQAEVFEAIQEERFLELCAEGQRWYDFSRIKQNNYKWARAELAETDPATLQDMSASETFQFVWPIYFREISVNDALCQTPGYGGNECN